MTPRSEVIADEYLALHHKNIITFITVILNHNNIVQYKCFTVFLIE